MYALFVGLSKVRVQNFSVVKLPDGLLQIKVLLVLLEVCELQKARAALNGAAKIVAVEITAEE